MQRVISIEAVDTTLLEFTNSVSNASHTMRVNEEAFIAEVESKHNFGLLPQNIRWASSDMRSLIIEEPPTKRKITFRPGKKEDIRVRAKDYVLQLPYMVYGISPAPSLIPYVSHIYSRLEPISGMLDGLWPSGVPNSFTTGAVCTHQLPDNSEGLPYHVLVNRAISEYWNSVFNNDVSEYMRTWFYRYLNEAGTYAGYKIPYAYWARLTLDQVEKVKRGSPVATVTSLGDALLKENNFYSTGTSLAARVLQDLVVNSMKTVVSS